MQLTYWPPYDANRLELGQSLNEHLVRYRENFVRQVPEPYRDDSAAVTRATGQDCYGGVVDEPGQGAEVGNLTWACHNMWLYYRHTMDDRLLREDLFPLLRRAINYYLHFLKEGDDGRLHLPTTFSPEYGTAPDCNCDLSLLRWGCGMLLQSWGGKIRIFPAVPSAWKNVMIHDLRTEGAFLVSAERRDGVTRWVGVRSLAGEPCMIKTDLKDPVDVVAGDRDVTIEPAGESAWRLGLKRGQEAVLATRGQSVEPLVRPVKADRDQLNSFGMR